jgi:flavorubredoxin
MPAKTQTRIDEIGDGIYRLNTPFPDMPGGFSLNQYLVIDDEPLLFHTGPRPLAEDVLDTIARVLPIEKLRWVAFSHGEQDESGALTPLLSAAPRSRPVCSRIAAMLGNAEAIGRAPHALADGETLCTGRRTFRWLDAPHVPHGWDCGYLLDTSSRTLFCGDLFAQPGFGEDPLTESDILGPSEAFRSQNDYYAHSPATRSTLEKLAGTEPHLLACMHGSAWRGDGGSLLRQLAQMLGA